MIIDEHTYNIGFHWNVLFYFILKQNQNQTEKFAILEFVYLDVFVDQLNNYHTN